MKKQPILNMLGILVLSAVLLLIGENFIHTSLATTNLLLNSDFENGPSSWLKVTNGGRSITNLTAHTGVSSHQQVVNSQFFRDVYQDVPVTANTSYDVSGWMSANGVNGGGAKINVHWLNAAGLPETYSLTNQIIRSDTVGPVMTGTQPWTLISNSFTAPLGAVVARLELYTSADPDGVGTAWFDDLSISTTTVVPDTIPPVLSSGNPASVLLIGTTSTTLTLSTNENAICKYGTIADTSYDSIADTFSQTGGLSHSQVLTGLTVGSHYDFYVRCQDQSGNVNTTDYLISFSALADTTSPSVSFTSPTDNATVSGVLSVSASATDNVGVVGVQFLLDNINLGAEQTASPYAVTWDTLTAADGNHTLTATARDSAGNSTTSNITVAVDNTSVPTPATNIVFNPGFENGPLNWLGATSGGRSVVTTQFHTGTASEQVSVSKQYSRIVYQDVSISIDQAYEFSGWVKTSGVGGSGAKIQIVWLTAAGLPETFYLTPSQILRTDVLGTAVGTSAWTYFANVYLAPAGSVVARIELTTSTDPDNSGTAWFDDLSALVTVPGVDTTPPNSAVILPVANSTISNTATFTVSASDNNAVAQVQILIDNVLVGQPDATAPYTLAIDVTSLSNGPHTVTAVATDASGNNGTSAGVTYLVDNTNRPNIVFVITDDQRFDTMQYMPITSALLGPDSVKFTNATVSTSVCCPSRATALTGLYAHNTGVRFVSLPNGGAAVFNDTSTFPLWLQTTGYRTALMGKYLNGYKLISPRIPPGWNEWQVFNNDAVEPFYNYELNENGTIVNYGSSPDDYSTDLLARRSVDFINSTPSNQPLMLYLAPFAPHHPYTPAPSDIDTMSNIAPWRPPSFNEADVSDKPQWIKNIPLLTATEIAQVDLARQRQLESLQAVDRAVGQVVNALIQTGRLQNTYFIYTSDNGFLWGEHRVIEDKICAYEECNLVPLWVKGPNITGGTNDRLVQNIDFAPTIADFAGVGVPSFVNGMSFKNLLLDPQAQGHSEVLYEGWGHFNGQNSIRGYYAVRNSRYVYVEDGDGNRELYDLQTDPYQMNNVYSDPANSALVSTLRSKLNALKKK